MIDYKIYLITNKGYEKLGNVHTVDELLTITDNIVDRHSDKCFMIVKYDPDERQDNTMLVYWGVPSVYESWKEKLLNTENIKKR